KGMSGSRQVPIATLEPSGTKRATASRMFIALLIARRPGSAADQLDIGAVVALDLLYRVTAELLQEGLGQHQPRHRLADHTRRRDHADVAALVVRLDLLLGLEVDGVHRLFHCRDRLDRDPQVDRLAVRHAPREATGAV